MKRLYRKIARAMFMNAYHDELCDIAKDLRNSKDIGISLEDYKKCNMVIGKIDILEKLDLLS